MLEHADRTLKKMFKIFLNDIIFMTRSIAGVIQCAAAQEPNDYLFICRTNNHR